MNKIFFMVRRVMLPFLLANTDIAYPQELEPIQLVKPQIDGGKPLMVVLNDRKTSRSFNPKKISMQILSNMLWAASGINRPESGKRTSPSANNRQEIDIYIATAEGLFLYEAKSHILRQTLAIDIRAMTGRQSFVCDAPVNLIFVANFSLMGETPNFKKVLYSAADTGYISQNVYLYCASEGLASCARGLIDRPALAKAMRLSSDQRIILAQSVGYPKQT